MDDILYID